MRSDGFVDFLARSLDVLEREMGVAYRAMCRALVAKHVRIEADGETVVLAFSLERAHFAAERAADVEVRTDRRAILALVDGESTLLEAVRDEALWMRGAPADVLCFHDGLMAYLHGAVRAPSFPRLLRDYRGGLPHDGRDLLRPWTDSSTFDGGTREPG